MRNYVPVFAVIVMFFSVEHTQAMIPPVSIYSHFADPKFPDFSLVKEYAAMQDRQSCWIATEGQLLRTEFWPLLNCICDGRLQTLLAFSEDGCPLTTQNIAKGIIEYFRWERYLTEGGDYAELLFAKLSEPEQALARTIIRANLLHHTVLIDSLRTSELQNSSIPWLLEILD
jgi:hypothetical protein